MGDNCPIPVIKTKKAMQALTGPETIEVLVDNEIAVQNVTKLAKEQGGEVSSEKLGEKEYKVTIKMQGVPVADAEVKWSVDSTGYVLSFFARCRTQRIQPPG